MSLVRTAQTVWLSKGSRVRFERARVTVHRGKRAWSKGRHWRNVTARYLTVKFRNGAGYVDPNGRRGWTLTAGTRVHGYRAGRRKRHRVAVLLTRNGNHPRKFYPAWF
jgi:hypothetical protein